MPNNSRTGANFYANWLNSQSWSTTPSPWGGGRPSSRTVVDEEQTAAAGAHTHQVSVDEAGDENFALPVEEPVFVPAPEDPMVPHESDTTAIRSIRMTIVENDPSSTGNMRDVLRSLCGIARSNYNARRGQPQRQEAPSFPPLGEAPPGMMRRRTRSGSVRPEPENTQTFFGNVPETSTMTTIAQNFGMRVNYPTIEKHPFIVGTNLAGVEIELENLNIEHPSFNYWTAKSDGSLRNGGMEFVCSHPWGGVDLYNAALEIDSFLFNNNPDDTWRCSTHVHVDVRDLTAAQLKKMILAYVFYERVLFKCSGWHRYKNNFCVALGFAQGQLDDLANWWDLPDAAFLNRLVSNWDKYTAINFLPMGNFGSVEFRISEAKWHKGQLIRLANRFLSLKEVAVENAAMTDEEFIEHLLQTEITDVIRKGVPRGIGNIQPDIEVGYKLAYDIISLAKLRRRSRRLFMPDVTDGTRVMNNVEIFSNGWSHCRSHLMSRYPELEFPDHPGRDITFAWLYELRKMMRRHRLTFENVWFMPEQNREQLKRLFRQYCSDREAGEMGEVQAAPVARAAASSGVQWMDVESEPDYEEPDEDEDVHDEEW